MAAYCRLHVVWSLVNNDARVCTFDLIRVTDDTEGAAEALFDAWWADLKQLSNSNVSLDQYRWYTSGTSALPIGGDFGPAYRVIERNVEGTGDSSNVGVAGALLPPQVAVVVTEMIGEGRIHRGRTYLPVGIGAMLTSDGRMEGASLVQIVDAYETLHEGLVAAGFGPFVLANAAGTRATYMIDGYRANNTWDIQRRRGYESPTNTELRAVTPFV